MIDPDDDGIYVRLRASPMRRGFAVTVLYALGALLLYLAATQPPEPAWLVLLLVIGLGALWLAEKLRQATRGAVVLTGEGLFTDGGDCLAALEDIDRVERGAFAFKPSNGFLVRLRRRGPRGWAPGLWWRVGRRLGLGGVTPAGQSKAMADALAILLAGRDGDQQ